MKSLFRIFALVMLIGLFAMLLAVLPTFAQEHNMNMGANAVKFNITMSDYSFSVEGQKAGAPLQLQTGQDYQLTFTNASALKMAHEVLFGKDVTKFPGGFSHTFKTPLLADVPVMLVDPADKDFMVDMAGLDEFQIGVGRQTTIEFTLPDSKVGSWEMGCFEFVSMDNTDDKPGPTHYDVGMHLPIVVTMGMHM